jgi:hypothetical protein
MEHKNLIEYIFNQFGNAMIEALREHLISRNNEKNEPLELSRVESLGVSIFPKPFWFDKQSNVVIQTKVDQPGIFNISWARLEFCYKTSLANGRTIYSEPVKLYLYDQIDWNLVSLFNVATRMEPLFYDTLSNLYNFIVMTEHPGLRPLLHVIKFIFYHPKYNFNAPTIQCFVQWPEMILLERKQSFFKADDYYSLEKIENGHCYFKYTVNLNEFKFVLPLTKYIYLDSLQRIVKAVGNQNIVFPMFVYESIIYGDELVNKQKQQENEVEIMSSNGIKICDYSTQAFEFLPISPIMTHVPNFPIRLESHEKTERTLLALMEF